MQAPRFPNDGHRVLLCVCGGIAAYKSAELVRRLRENSELQESNRATYYGGGAEGYTDYPMLAQSKA